MQLDHRRADLRSRAELRRIGVDEQRDADAGIFQPGHDGAERRALPGLRAFLEAARAAGHPIGLGTGSVPETIAYIIDHLDLRRYFDVVVGKDDVRRGKPHPDTFAVVAARLGTAPADCLVFEDAVLGEQAAYQAGMRCVAVATTLPAAAFQAPLAVISDFTGLTPARLQALLPEQPAAPRPDPRRARRQYLHR
ncbi:MAG: hypothetical protein NVSMB30_20500 [Hymenobacter sp.]